MRLVLLFVGLTVGLLALGQNPFQNISLKDAYAKASHEGKLVLLQYESADCAQCNDVANKGFSDPALSARLSSTFICIRIAPNHPDRKKISAQYNLGNRFGSLFLDAQGRLVHSFMQTTTMASSFNGQVDIALYKAGESMQLATLEKEYSNNNRSPGFMELYILKRKSLGLPIDSLLDEYAGNLPPDSLRSSRALQFIASMAPILGSTADEIFRHDQLQFDHAWYLLPVRQRTAINIAIIGKSVNRAVQDNNEAYALQVAGFAQSTYVSDASSGLRAYENTMMDFYRQTGDTTKYFPVAQAYYNRYFMNVNTDSVKRVDSVRLKQLLAAAPVVRDTVINGNTVRTTQKVRFASYAQNYTRELARAAQTVYESSTNPALLADATRWVKKGLEFSQTYEALDVYARLLFAQGSTAVAIDTEQQAINLKKKQGYPTADLEKELERMKRK